MKAGVQPKTAKLRNSTSPPSMPFHKLKEAAKLEIEFIDKYVPLLKSHDAWKDLNRIIEAFLDWHDEKK